MTPIWTSRFIYNVLGIVLSTLDTKSFNLHDHLSTAITTVTSYFTEGQTELRPHLGGWFWNTDF